MDTKNDKDLSNRTLHIDERHVIRSPFTVDIPNVDNFTFLSSVFKKLPNNPAIIELETGRSKTYAELDDALERLAGYFYHDLGIRCHDRIAVYSTNCIEFPVVMLAILRLGAAIVTINGMSTADELIHYLNTTSPKYLIAQHVRIDAARRAADKLNIKVLALDGSTDTVTVQSIIQQTSSSYRTSPDVSSLGINPRKDVTIINFSSGTSGLPKAVMNSHRNMITACCGLSHPVLSSNINHYLIYQPLSHIFGLGMTTHALNKGILIIIMKQFSVDRYLKAVQDYKISRLYMVPAVATLLAKSGLREKFDLGHVKIVVLASSPFRESGERELKQFFKNEQLIINQAYGLSECAGLATHGVSDVEMGRRLLPGVNHNPPGSVGLAFPGTEMMIVNIDKPVSVRVNQTGEIWIRSPMVMLGYLNNVEATNETIVNNGWLRSGDIGYYNEDGYVFIVDRLKELIKYKSYQVAPAELEALILSHPSVADVGVIRVPDQEAGELPQAWVVKKPGHEGLTDQQITDWVKDKAAPYKWLRGGVRFVDSIPRNPTGKILRRLMTSTTAPQAKL